MDGYDVFNGIIQSPGKFEGCPEWAPAFWGDALSGMADEDDGDTFVFDVEPMDVEQFPSLAGFSCVYLWEDSQGFVNVNAVED